MLAHSSATRARPEAISTTECRWSSRAREELMHTRVHVERQVQVVAQASVRPDGEPPPRHTCRRRPQPRHRVWTFLPACRSVFSGHHMARAPQSYFPRFLFTVQFTKD